MRTRSEHLPAGNLTELWWDAEKQNMLTLNGFSGDGSDFEVFRDLCICFDRTPDAPVAQQCRDALRLLFDCDLPVDSAHCREIWRLTADELIAIDHFRAEVSGLRSSGNPNPLSGWGTALMCTPPNDLFWLDGWRSRAGYTDWKSWAAELERVILQEHSEPHLALALPASFVPVMPNLYRANRWLNREDQDGNLWLSQLAFFLFRFCAERNLRATVYSACPAEQVTGLAERLAKLTPLPGLVWMSDFAIPDAALLALCGTVLRFRRAGQEGIPPVLLAVPGQEGLFCRKPENEF